MINYEDSDKVVINFLSVGLLILFIVWFLMQIPDLMTEYTTSQQVLYQTCEINTTKCENRVPQYDEKLIKVVMQGSDPLDSNQPRIFYVVTLR